MKKLMPLFFIVSIWGLAVSCDDSKDIPVKEIGTPDSFPTYRISNKSGHTVSIVHQPSCIQMPDSLVLINRTDFYLATMETDYDEWFGIIDMETKYFDRQLIYYDGRYVMDLTKLPTDRDLQNMDSYVQLDILTYQLCLTEEDYDYAVKNGTDLGERIP